MAKQINAVLLRGDLLSFMETQGLSALGYSEQVDLTDNVPGAFVARTAGELVRSSDEYFEVVAGTEAEGWTVLTDPTGFLVEDLEGWAALSAELSTRIICMRHGDLGVELAVFDEGRATRIVSFEPGEGATFVGRPLAFEDMWEAYVPSAEELLETVACISLDLERANASALYRIGRYRYCETMRSVELPEQSEPEFVPDNVVNILSAAS